MDADRSDPCWPVPLWLAQLLPAGLVAALSGWLWRVAGPDWRVAAVAAFAVAWTVAVLAVAWRARSWIVARRAQWLTVGVATAVTLAIGDAAINVSGLVPTIEQQRARSPGYTIDRYTSYRFVPGTFESTNGRQVTINARGYRGADVATAKTPGRARVAFLGGSQVFALEAGDWPAETGRLLQARGFDVEVVNAGVPGYSTNDTLRQFATDLWVLEPDVVFLCQAWNDVKYFPRMTGGVPFRGAPPAEPLTWMPDWRLYPRALDAAASISALYRLARWHVLTIAVAEEGGNARTAWSRDPAPTAHGFGPHGPRQYAHNLALIASLTERIGARLVLCRQARMTAGTTATGVDAAAYAARNTHLAPETLDEALAACDAAVAEVARAYGAPVVDLHDALSGSPALFVDAIHFTPEGGRAAARLVSDAIAPLLRGEAASR